MNIVIVGDGKVGAALTEHLSAEGHDVVVFVGIFLVCFDNVDMQEAIGAVLTCFNNVGPAFGRLSPVGNFSELSCFTKLVLSFLMLAGRLEIYPMLIVFYYKAWKRKN